MLFTEFVITGLLSVLVGEPKESAAGVQPTTSATSRFPGGCAGGHREGR